MVLMFSPKNTTKRHTVEISQQVTLNNQSQETQLSFKYHHIMASVTKLIPSVMSINLLLKNQRQISLNMLIMTKRFSDILLDSTQRSQRTLIEDLSFLSIWLMTPFPFSNQLRRILVSLKDHSQREESIKMLTRVWNSLLQVNFLSVEILKSMVTTSICQDVTITLPSISLHTHTDFAQSNFNKVINVKTLFLCFIYLKQFKFCFFESFFKNI